MPYFTDDDGVRFYYQDLGERSSPAVLLVNSWTFDTTMWEYQVPALLAAGFRCVTMDRRGHGRSDEPGTGYDLDTLAGDLGALVAHLGLAELSVVAHSMGCTETVRFLRSATGVLKVILVGTVTPGLRTLVGDDDYAAALAEVRADRAQWFASRRDGYFAMPRSGVSPALADDVMVTALRVPIEVMIACQHAGTGTDVTDDLRAIDRPVLLIHGDADESAPLDLTARLTEKLIKGSELVVYDGAPHGLYVSHAARLNGDLVDFLR